MAFSAWITNTSLTPLDPAECKEVSEKNKAKSLLNAYKVASEGHDLAYFKGLLADHQAALQQEMDEIEAEEEAKAKAKAEKAEKAASKKTKRKSKGAETDVEMEDADEPKKPKSATKKRKKDAETDGEAEKVSWKPSVPQANIPNMLTLIACKDPEDCYKVETQHSQGPY